MMALGALSTSSTNAAANATVLQDAASRIALLLQERYRMEGQTEN